jgi:putative two-component system response regulator
MRQPRLPSVLIVDDSTALRCVVARWLRESGYQCFEASDAASARRWLSANSAELMTLDVAMPGESGIQFLAEVRRSAPDMEVLMLTGREGTELAIRAMTLGAYGYLVKPAQKEELLISVRRALEHRQLILDKRRHVLSLEHLVREQTLAIRRAQEETIVRLVRASMLRDEETGAHIRRTGLYSAVIAESIGWSSEQVDLIRMAAPMHDVGKIGIPDSILRTPGKLTDSQYEIMKRHAVIGARMLSGTEVPLLKMAREIALSHHERWDGRGYPRKLAGEEIPVAARIVAIVDVYDALTHDRVYRPAFSEEQAMTIMNDGRGQSFDPELFSHFTDVLEEIRCIAYANNDDVDPWEDAFEDGLGQDQFDSITAGLSVN